jgi:hypothetical protein
MVTVAILMLLLSSHLVPASTVVCFDTVHKSFSCDYDFSTNDCQYADRRQFKSYLDTIKFFHSIHCDLPPADIIDAPYKVINTCIHPPVTVECTVISGGLRVDKYPVGIRWK